MWQNHKKSHKKTYKNGQKIVRLYYHLTKQLDLKENKALKNENQHKIIWFKRKHWIKKLYRHLKNTKNKDKADFKKSISFLDNH